VAWGAGIGMVQWLIIGTYYIYIHYTYIIYDIVYIYIHYTYIIYDIVYIYTLYIHYIWYCIILYYIYIWLVVATLWKIWVRQLGRWHSQYMEK
jgi:hypothetical protein